MGLGSRYIHKTFGNSLEMIKFIVTVASNNAIDDPVRAGTALTSMKYVVPEHPAIKIRGKL